MVSPCRRSPGRCTQNWMHLFKLDQHGSDVAHDIAMFFTCQLSDLTTRHREASFRGVGLGGENVQHGKSFRKEKAPSEAIPAQHKGLSAFRLTYECDWYSP